MNCADLIADDFNPLPIVKLLLRFGLLSVNGTINFET
jgi:hypothetical protein